MTIVVVVVVVVHIRSYKSKPCEKPTEEVNDICINICIKGEPPSVGIK